MANFDATKAVFTQVDANRDGSIDQNEFRNWASNAGGARGLTASSYETPSSQSSTGRFDSSAGQLNRPAGLVGVDGFNRSAGLVGVGGFNRSAGSAGVGGYEASAQSSFESAAAAGASSSEFIGGATVQQTNEYYSQLPSGLYKDPDPQVIRRQATGGPVTYQQRILVRFLQPPPIASPGPLIIKEVRPPQPPPPPPLVVRQRAPPLPQLPPLILRERPPAPPPSAASQTVIRRLAAIPLPPRSVIIERLPPLPPRPRDIIIERWIPYGAQAKRRTIVQRDTNAIQYPKPRNIIVVYDTVQANVIRQFQRLGVTPENPQAYISRYGVSLLDAATLVQQARAAGVVEDISPPTQFSSPSSFNVSTGGGVATGFDRSNLTINQGIPSSPYNVGAGGGGRGGVATGFDRSNLTISQGFPSSPYGVGTGGRGGGAAGFDRSNAAISQGLSSPGATGFQGLQVVGGAETSAYDFEDPNSGNANSFSSSNFIDENALAGRVGVNNASFFAAADTNNDGRLNQAEFQRFVQGSI